MNEISRELPLWQVTASPLPSLVGVRVRALTVSEARGLLKAHLSLERLPAGTLLASVEQMGRAGLNPGGVERR